MSRLAPTTDYIKAYERMKDGYRKRVMTDLLTGYVEYEVVGAVELTSWVYRSARVHAVVGRRHVDDPDAAVVPGETNSLAAEQPASPHKSTVQSVVLSADEHELTTHKCMH